MPELTIDDVVLLIHSEIASAVTSAQQFGSMESVVLDAVRVRIGQPTANSEPSNNQPSDEAVSVDASRYPQSKNGWQIDVFYRAGNQSRSSNTKSNDDSGWLASEALGYFSQLPVKYLSGIGKRFASLLEKNQITSVEQLLEHSLLTDTALIKVLSARRLRHFQSLARLCVAVPSIVIPESINRYCLMEALDNFSQLNREILRRHMTEDQSIQFYNWLQQLELCLDDNLLLETCFSDLKQV